MSEHPTTPVDERDTRSVALILAHHLYDFQNGDAVGRAAERVVAGGWLAEHDRRLRAVVAEEIAREIEVSRGVRCPACGGKPASTKWKGLTRIGRCGTGHRWELRSAGWRHAEDVAREHGQARTGGPTLLPPDPSAGGRASGVGLLTDGGSGVAPGR